MDAGPMLYRSAVLLWCVYMALEKTATAAVLPVTLTHSWALVDRSWTKPRLLTKRHFDIVDV